MYLQGLDIQHVTKTRTGLSVSLDASGMGIVCPIQSTGR